MSEEQKRIAEDAITIILRPDRIVTDVVPAGPFWKAEPEYQNFLDR